MSYHDLKKIPKLAYNNLKKIQRSEGANRINSNNQEKKWKKLVFLQKTEACTVLT